MAQDEAAVGIRDYIAEVGNLGIWPKNNRKTLKGFKQKERDLIRSALLRDHFCHYVEN